MKSFIYSAYDVEGLKIGGVVEAENIDQARVSLQGKQLMIVSIKEKIDSGKLVWSLRRKVVGARELEYLTSELSLLLASGVTLDRALGVMKRSSVTSSQLELIANLSDSVRRGETLSQAMLNSGEVFSALYINLVKLGESSGTLPLVFDRLAQDLRYQSELKTKVVQALTYPAVILSVCVLCVFFILNFIVPQMSGLFNGLTEIPSYTAFLLGLSEWMIKYQFFLVLSTILVVIALIGYFKTPSGASWSDEFIIQVPWVGRIYVLLERIRFNTAISLMLQSGVLIDKSLEMALGSVKSASIRQGLVVAKNRVKKGETLAEALNSNPLYPDFSLSLIEAGEESGQLTPVFTELSRRARREFEAWVDRFTTLLEPLLILFMSLIVGGVVVIMLLSVVSVNEISL